jgi:thiol:disulfide interchange protein DsbC
MRKIILLILMSSCLVLSGYEMAYAFAQGDQDCSKCHTLSSEQATKTLSQMIPDIKVLKVAPSDVKGLWEISMETGGRKIIAYLDYSGKHLMAGNLFLIQTKTNLTQEKLQDLTRVDISQIPLKDALVLGDKSAKYKVIVFDDPD